MVSYIQRVCRLQSLRIASSIISPGLVTDVTQEESGYGAAISLPPDLQGLVHPLLTCTTNAVRSRPVWVQTQLPSSHMAGQSFRWNGLLGAYLKVDDDKIESESTDWFHLTLDGRSAVNTVRNILVS
jgi:hypothetical protein